MRLSPIPYDPGERLSIVAMVEETRLRGLRIREAYAQADEEASNYLIGQVRSGALSVDDANAAHTHRVWTRVANRLSSDITYTWEMLTE